MAGSSGLTGPAVIAGAGTLLLYSGIRGKGLLSAARGLLHGQAPSGAPPANAITGTTPAQESGLLPGEGSAPPGNTGASSPSAAANQALARMLAVSMGHADWTTGQQWADWVSLWNQESGWSTTAHNASGATGIPQLLPSAHAIPPGWSSATVQITWGINYIAGRYGSPSAAWAHEVANNWY